MKKIFLFCLFAAIAGMVQAQNVPEPMYKKDPNLPNFNLLLTDSTSFTKELVPKYEHTFLIYFSPDCPHCQHEVKDISLKMDSLKNAFFIFVNYNASLRDIKSFAEYYQMDKFPNVRFARDPQYFIPSFFRVTRIPFIAQYDKSWKLVRVFDPEKDEVPDAAALAKLLLPKN